MRLMNNGSYLLEKGMYRDIEYAVTFGSLGYRLDYVALPKPLTEKELDNIRCHWDLTYENGDDLLGLDESKFWVGFDCGHAGDKVDDELLLKLYGKTRDHTDSGIVRSTEYCVENCKGIIDQYYEVETIKKSLLEALAGFVSELIDEVSDKNGFDSWEVSVGVVIGFYYALVSPDFVECTNEVAGVCKTLMDKFGIDYKNAGYLNDWT